MAESTSSHTDVEIICVQQVVDDEAHLLHRAGWLGQSNHHQCYNNSSAQISEHFHLFFFFGFKRF